MTFVMAINTMQGQKFKLRWSISFQTSRLHGQLYVTISHVTLPFGLWFLILNKNYVTNNVTKILFTMNSFYWILVNYYIQIQIQIQYDELANYIKLSITYIHTHTHTYICTYIHIVSKSLSLQYDKLTNYIKVPITKLNIPKLKCNFITSNFITS